MAPGVAFVCVVRPMQAQSVRDVLLEEHAVEGQGDVLALQQNCRHAVMDCSDSGRRYRCVQCGQRRQVFQLQRQPLTAGTMSDETDTARREAGYMFTDQSEVVKCPNNADHGLCKCFRSQKGELWHKCEKCIEKKEFNKDGTPNKYFDQPGVMICKDGQGKKLKPANGTKRKADAAAPPSASGVQTVDHSELYKQTLEDIAKKVDMVYNMLYDMVESDKKKVVKRSSPERDVVAAPTV